MSTITKTTRRTFLKTAAAGVGLGLGVRLWDSPRVLGAGERLNVGVIGVGGRGAADLAAMASENVVALCDVDTDRLEKAHAKFPAASKYVDYRKLLEQQNLDAVVVATPDHHHAPASLRAIRRGLHVYCEKPLTHTVREARVLAEAAREAKVATQMGTQNHEHPGYLRTVEWLQKGAIGPVREVHVVTDRPGRWWPQGLDRPTDAQEIPGNLKWNLWLGPAPERPYHPAYVPFRWRGWWEYGCGAIGDMAIHLLDPAFWALRLSGPVKVSAQSPPPHPASGPKWMIAHYQFPQRGDLAPCDVYWYEGEAKLPERIADELPMNGSLFIGDEGRLAVQHGGMPKLLPEDKFQDYQPPEPFLPPSPGHHRQWIEACKTGSRTGSNFDYAGPFTEIVLLGNVAHRCGQTIQWDPEAMKIANVAEANALLTKEYREGWEV